MPHIDAIGAKLYFEETGRGYPIIFLHEFGSDCRQWESQIRHFSGAYRCITYNARGYPPSDVPEDPALYGWELSVADIAAVMRGLAIECAHLVGTSMGGYAALQFGLRYPDRASAIVAAAVGSGSNPAQRDAWLRETAVLARTVTERGIGTLARRMAQGPTRVQLKYKDPTSWTEFAERLSQHSAQGLAHTLTRCLSVRPPLHAFRDQFAKMAKPVFLAVGDEDVPCLETNLMLKSALPAAGLWICPNTGHAINLEEPSAFNTQVESFFTAVECESWRRGFPKGEQVSDQFCETSQAQAVTEVCRSPEPRAIEARQ